MTSRHCRITVDIVEKLIPGTIAWDTKLRGFGCRCQRKERIYFLKKRFEGRQRWFVIGPHGNPWTPEKARREAERLLGEIRGGRDPGTERDRLRGLPDVAGLAEAFVEQHIGPRLKASTATHYRSLIADYVVPRLGKLRVDQVTDADVGHLHHALRDRPYQANRALAVLSKMFSFAERRGLRAKGTNPCKGQERFKEKHRERWLSDQEMADLGQVLDRAAAEGHASVFAIAAIKLLLFTGARRGEILSLKWDHVDLERRVLALPDSKTGAKLVGLSAPAVDVLLALPRVAGNPYVIVGERPGKHMVNLTKPWKRLRALASDLRLHDLRHNYGSRAASTGHALPIVAKQMGHTQIATTARYAHAMPDPVRQMNEAVGTDIARALASSGIGRPDDGEIGDAGS
jgi:integrase